MQEYRTWRARLDEIHDDIHDADTVRLVCDTGFDDTTRKWFRLRRVFAPELKQAGGEIARDWVVEWFLIHSTSLTNWPLEVDTYRTSGGNDVKTLDRYVAEIRCTEDGANLNDAVIGFLAQHPEWPKGIGA